MLALQNLVPHFPHQRCQLSAQVPLFSGRAVSPQLGGCHGSLARPAHLFSLKVILSHGQVTQFWNMRCEVSLLEDLLNKDAQDEHLFCALSCLQWSQCHCGQRVVTRGASQGTPAAWGLWGGKMGRMYFLEVTLRPLFPNLLSSTSRFFGGWNFLFPHF